MSKRIVLLVGAMFLALCLVPVVSAESSDTATAVNEELNPIKIDTPDATGDGWTWDKNSCTLTISKELHVSYVKISYSALSEKDVTVKIDKNLKITYKGDLGQINAFSCDAKSLTITGEGKLEIEIEAETENVGGIYSELKIVIKDLNSLSIKGPHCGISTDGEIEFDNVGSVSIESNGTGINFMGDVIIKNCKNFSIKLIPAEDTGYYGGILTSNGGGTISIKDSTVEVTCTKSGAIAFQCGDKEGSHMDMGKPSGDVKFYSHPEPGSSKEINWDSNKVKEVVIVKDNGTAKVSSQSDNTLLIVGIVIVVILALALLGYNSYNKKKQEPIPVAPAEPEVKEPKQ